ncbi:MAG: type II toxin-antitoxin system VapC family toxin [Opitutae bacterium]|nr:type II toxin-antitoxin system VapC family toxin [Opitutae bacterium]
MNWLLDTCVICEPTQARPSPRVLNWLREQPEETLHLSVLTLGEIRRGCSRLPAGPKRRALEHWLDRDLAERFAGRILPLDTPAADLWGRMLAGAEAKGRALPTLDSLLAATALAHGLSLVTRNVADFATTGAELFNPWE